MDKQNKKLMWSDMTLCWTLFFIQNCHWQHNSWMRIISASREAAHNQITILLKVHLHFGRPLPDDQLLFAVLSDIILPLHRVWQNTADRIYQNWKGTTTQTASTERKLMYWPTIRWLEHKISTSLRSCKAGYWFWAVQVSSNISFFIFL